jgi:hypothetical protein
MRKITCKNKRFPVCAHAIFAIAICLCMLFAACKDEPDDTPPPPPENNPPSFGTGTVTLGTPNGTELKPDGLTINLNGVSATDPDGDELTYKWSCTSYSANGNTVTGADSVATNLAIASGQDVSVTLNKAGLYKFVLTASDGKGGVATSNEVNVTVTPYTVEKDVEVSFSSFALGNTSADFSASYDPDNDEWGTNFSASDITYTLSDTLDHTWNSGTGFVVNVTDGPYVDGTTYNFTQTFKNSAGTVVGSQVIRIRVSYGTFMSLRNEADSNTGASTLSVVPLNLEKTISEN